MGKKGARNLVIKLKKAREGQDWGDCCKDYAGSDPQPLVEKQKKKEKRSKPQRSPDDSEGSVRTESKQDNTWIIALSASMGVLGVGIGLGLACGGFSQDLLARSEGEQFARAS